MRDQDYKHIFVAFGAVAAVVILYVALQVWGPFNQISSTKAQEICAAFLREVESDIADTPGFTVAGSKKECKPVEDEVGKTDYTNTASVRVAKEGLDSEVAARASMDELAQKMPQRNYPISVYNIPATSGQKGSICVIASIYIDNDGSDIPQGYSEHKAQYLTPDQAKDFTPCS